MEIARRRINEREQLIGARIMDNALFHKLLHQQRGKLNRLIDELNVGDTVYRSENILWDLQVCRSIYNMTVS
jgi:hypothetical protein